MIRILLMTRSEQVRKGLAAAMARAGVRPDAVQLHDGGRSIRHVDVVVSTDAWRLTGGDMTLVMRAAAWVLAKETELGAPDWRDGARVEPALSINRGFDAYGDPQVLVSTYTATRPRFFAKRAALAVVYTLPQSSKSRGNHGKNLVA
jgi:hypothetical protein